MVKLYIRVVLITSWYVDPPDIQSCHSSTYLFTSLIQLTFSRTPLRERRWDCEEREGQVVSAYKGGGSEGGQGDGERVIIG